MGIPLEGQSGTLLRFIALGGSSRHGIHRSGNYNYIFSGIKVTLDSMPDNGVILVFTDTGSHQLHLENSIKAKMEKKNVKVFFAFVGSWYPELSSAEVYNRLAKGQIFRSSSDGALSRAMPNGTFVHASPSGNPAGLDSDKFFKAVVHKVRSER